MKQVYQKTRKKCSQLPTVVVGWVVNETHMRTVAIKAQSRASYWSQTCNFACATTQNFILFDMCVYNQQTLHLPTLSCLAAYDSQLQSLITRQQ